jgi:hypothetical protein
MRVKTQRSRNLISYDKDIGSFNLEQSNNNESLNIRCKSENLTLNTSATTSVHTSWLPAGMILGCVARVTSTITGATVNMSLGPSSATTAFCNAKASKLAIGTTMNSFTEGAMTGPIVLAAATNLTFTSSSGNITAGAVRVTVYYLDLTVPTA